MKKTYDIQSVTEFLVSQYMRLGCSKQEADNCIHSLILSEVCGEYSHGLRMAYKHAERLARKGYSINKDLIIEIETGSFARINCQNMIGMHSATECMKFAIEKSKESGLYVIFANNCNTFSAAVPYVLQSIESDIIGIVMCNTPAQMPPYNGIGRLIGTNPICFGFPAKNEDPIIFDMATSNVAKSKITAAREKGESIPLGWALNKEGKPTSDAEEAIKGLLLPFAHGPKGIGIAMMIDLLSGVLSGAGYLNKVNYFATDNMNVGQVFIAIDPTIVLGSCYFDRVDDFVKTIKTSPAIDEVQEVQLPGANKIRLLKKYPEYTNIEIEDFVYNEMKKIEEL